MEHISHAVNTCFLFPIIFLLIAVKNLEMLQAFRTRWETIGVRASLAIRAIFQSSKTFQGLRGLSSLQTNWHALCLQHQHHQETPPQLQLLYLLWPPIHQQIPWSPSNWGERKKEKLHIFRKRLMQSIQPEIRFFVNEPQTNKWSIQPYVTLNCT